MELKKNSTFTIDITGMTHDGIGVGRVNNFAVFVPGAIDGETVIGKIIKVTKSYAVARMENRVMESSERVEPSCPSYKRCGGCSIQHMSYKKQLEFKKNIVEETLTRIGGLKDIIVNSTIGMEYPYEYRNKVQYPVGIIGGKPAAGFYARRSHDIIECDSCGIQDRMSGQIKNIVLDFIIDNDVSVYNEDSGKGQIRHIVVRRGYETGEIMVIIVSTNENLKNSDELIKRLTRQVEEISSIILNVNVNKGNAILGKQIITLYGKDSIQDKIGEYIFEISPVSFYQVNPKQTKKLYDKVIEYAGLNGTQTVFDLYCGIGTIGIYLSGKAKKVIGVEVVPEAIEDARKNAAINNLENVEYHCGKAEKIIPALYQQGLKADVIVVDPPRKGCYGKLLETIVDMQPERIIYVSCKPSTLARDLKYLTLNGFTVKEVQPVDMFPHTEHCESVVLLHRV